MSPSKAFIIVKPAASCEDLKVHAPAVKFKSLNFLLQEASTKYNTGLPIFLIESIINCKKNKITVFIVFL